VAVRAHAKSDAATFDETRGERWMRRAITAPTLLALTPAYAILSPALIAAAASRDLVRRQPWTATRFTLALQANLTLHAAGLAAMAGAWLLGGRWAGADPERERRLEQRLQVRWAQLAWSLTARLYSMRLVVDGDDCVEPGPLLVLSRHASLIDTLIPLLVLSGRHDLRLRYVIKRELLWDPCIDALGHRWPTAFVRRGTSDPHETAHVTHLLHGLGERDGIVLFPEGTRFSDAKRARILSSLRRTHPEAYARGVRLRHVLPPHPSGLLALLAHAPTLDVVFCAHTGLEGASQFRDLLAGSLLGRIVRVQLWRVRRAEIPAERDAQLMWLQDQWERVDRWIGANEVSIMPR
jgi:1-acyl-sn-glycerol-3-phosphate acyltransferase